MGRRDWGEIPDRIPNRRPPRLRWPLKTQCRPRGHHNEPSAMLWHAVVEGIKKDSVRLVAEPYQCLADARENRPVVPHGKVRDVLQEYGAWPETPDDFDETAPQTCARIDRGAPAFVNKAADLGPASAREGWTGGAPSH